MHNISVLEKHQKHALRSVLQEGQTDFLEEHQWETASGTFGNVLHYFCTISPFLQKQSPKETPEAVSQMCSSKRTQPKLCQTMSFL